MSLKSLAGKTLFFLLICLFVVAFSSAFGQENSLTGVVIVVLALMMLGQDLSVRPLMNLGGMVAFTLLMGVGAYVSVWCGNAFAGAVLNFTIVFLLSFLTTQDLRSPMHFPFLLGYAFMLAVPVSAEDLPIRILALVVGSVFIVALNVVLNRNRHARTCHDGIVSLCGEVSACCEDVLSGKTADPGDLDALCLRLRGSMYDRLRLSFFSTPGNRAVLDMVSALQAAGHAVCDRERDPDVLHGLMDLMSRVTEHENSGCSATDVSLAADEFLRRFGRADGGISASVVIMRDLLLSLEAGDDGRTDVRTKFRSMVREDLRTDSARFSFAVRMSVLFTLWTFVWQYWGLENAKWLLFTTVALVVPYVDGAWRKSAMRLTGTLAGVAAFAVVIVAVGGDVDLLTAALMLANYVYTVLSPKRYDVMMIFITFSALIAASMSVPADDAVSERVAYILMGIAAATVANYLLLPYRLSDENSSLARRYLRLNDGMMSDVSDSLEGRVPSDRVAVVTASGISSKMHLNLEARPDGNVSALLSHLDSVVYQCSFLVRASGTLSEEGRRCARSLLDGNPVTHPDGLTQGDVAYLSVLSSAVEAHRQCDGLLARA